MPSNYNFMQNQLSSPQPKQQCIILNISISQIMHTVIVDTQAQLEEMKRQVDSETFVLVQNYNHEMRSYKAVCCV